VTGSVTGMNLTWPLWSRRGLDAHVGWAVGCAELLTFLGLVVSSVSRAALPACANVFDQMLATRHQGQLTRGNRGDGLSAGPRLWCDHPGVVEGVGDGQPTCAVCHVDLWRCSAWDVLLMRFARMVLKAPEASAACGVLLVVLLCSQGRCSQAGGPGGQPLGRATGAA
jgi:hypothetical protein